MLGLAFALSLPDILRAGIGPGRLSHFSVDEARSLNGLIARGLNQLLAATFLTVAVAVPLTANMYSVKFLDFFLRDPVNAGVLGLVVFATFENAWVAYLIRDGFVPTFALQVAFVLLALCSAALLPYIYYVFRFLHPNTLLRRLEQQFEDALASARRRPERLAPRARAGGGGARAHRQRRHPVGGPVRPQHGDRECRDRRAARARVLGRQGAPAARLVPGGGPAVPELLVGSGRGVQRQPELGGDEALLAAAAGARGGGAPVPRPREPGGEGAAPPGARAAGVGGPDPAGGGDGVLQHVRAHDARRPRSPIRVHGVRAVPPVRRRG